jgi:hypothetical protein
MTRGEYIRTIRRAVESDDLVTAEALAIELDRLLGEPIEDDRQPGEIPCWGVAI